MFRESFRVACFFGLTMIPLLFLNNNFLQTSYAQQQIDPSCSNSSACGSIQNISYPFRLQTDPPYCGNSSYELLCENNNTMASIYLNSEKFYVREINYDNFTIRLVEASLIKNIQDDCSFAHYSFYKDNSSSYYLHTLNNYEQFTEQARSTSVTFLSCPHPMNNSAFVETMQNCFFKRNDHHYASSSSSAAPTNHNFSSNRITSYTYLKVGRVNASNLGEMCKIEHRALTSWKFRDENNVSVSEIHDSLLYGVELSWYRVHCNKCGKRGCYLSIDSTVECDRCYYTFLPCGHIGRFITADDTIFGLMQTTEAFVTYFIAFNIGTRILIGMPLMFGLLLYKYKRRHLSMFDSIERFLRSQNNLKPIRYSYSDLKRITRNFREKLGNGGYGTVYKGKLRSGRDVAVKVLNNTRANGQDFINEVATIGRIHHVNVVRLVGYCAERSSKRALAYDFMANGSLENYIFDPESSNSLSWEKKNEIAIGVARGIEYLHRGCDIQILHFDIKPHNVLLDENFTPKISDFGLAKFYSTDDSIVTLTAARGTIGYVAPELIHRSIGEVSYKADVYSFGMLLMEMIGLKRNLVENKDQSSQYFPYWIYSRLNEGKDIEIGNVDGDDDFTRKITKKIMIVALWCIQMSPGDRPSMSKVVEMLEGGDELLQVPPQPSQSPQIMVQDHDLTSGTNDSTDSIALLYDYASSNQ